MAPWAMEIDRYIEEARKLVGMLPLVDIRRVAEVLYQAWLRGSKVILLGNGGSAATASHFANDLNKGCAVPGKHRFSAIALTDNVPLITAWGNDTVYENVFAEQLPNFLRPGDVVVAISGSGNSPNVLKAVQMARASGALTLGFTGFRGGKLVGLVDYCIVVPSDCMEQIEDMHLLLEHCICTALRKRIAAQAPGEQVRGEEETAAQVAAANPEEPG